MSLAAQQAAFLGWIAHGGEDAPDATPASLAGLLADPLGASIYQNNYRSQLMAVLAESFPHTLAWVGEETFSAVAARHIDATPPQSFTLDAYPAAFPESLRLAWPDDPEVAELAALEWQLALAFVAADDAPLATADLPHLDWERVELRLVASAAMLSCVSNAPAIWSALAKDETPPDAEYAAAGRAILVWRQDFICCFREADADEAAQLQRMALPRAFADICADLATHHGEEVAPGMAGAMLARWIDNGLVVAVAPR